MIRCVLSNGPIPIIYYTDKKESWSFLWRRALEITVCLFAWLFFFFGIAGLFTPLKDSWLASLIGLLLFILYFKCPLAKPYLNRVLNKRFPPKDRMKNDYDYHTHRLHMFEKKLENVAESIDPDSMFLSFREVGKAYTECEKEFILLKIIRDNQVLLESDLDLEEYQFPITSMDEISKLMKKIK